MLCGRAFTLIIPRDEPEKDKTKLCGDCASLPEPPEEPTIGGEDAEPGDSSDSEDHSGV